LADGGKSVCGHPTRNGKQPSDVYSLSIRAKKKQMALSRTTKKEKKVKRSVYPTLGGMFDAGKTEANPSQRGTGGIITVRESAGDAGQPEKA